MVMPWVPRIEGGPSEVCRGRGRGWALSRTQHLTKQWGARSTSRLPSEDIKPGDKPIFMPFCSGLLALKKKKAGQEEMISPGPSGSRPDCTPQHRHPLSFPWGTRLARPAWGLGSHWVLHPNFGPAAPHPQTHPTPCAHPGGQRLTPLLRGGSYPGMDGGHRALLSHTRQIWGDPCCGPTLVESLARCCCKPAPTPPPCRLRKRWHLDRINTASASLPAS